MQPIRLALLFAALSLVTPAAGPLRVLRVTPTTPASPGEAVTVTFDRPVAGGLDATVDARAIFSIEPAVAGVVEWRDPVTLRFTPAAPFTPGATYRIRVSDTFQAMDGSQLSAPFEASFRVAPPRILGGEPAHPNDVARYLTPRPVFALLVSSPPDTALLARLSHIQLERSCGVGAIGVKVVAERKVTEEDPPYFRYAGYQGPYPYDPARDLRRVVEVEPVSALPLACSGVLSLPRDVEPNARERQEWKIATYGPLHLERASCGNGTTCPTGPIRVHFSTPVRGGEVERHLRIVPKIPFTVADTATESATWLLEARLEPRKVYSVVADSGLTDIFGQRLGRTEVKAFSTTGYAPSVSYEFGRLLVEREGLRTLAVQHVNVDSLQVTVLPVPDSMAPLFLGRMWGWEEPWEALVKATGGGTRRTVKVRDGQDERRVSGIALQPAGLSTTGTLLAVKISSPQLDSLSRRHRPIALVQVTDLAVTARVGADQAMVWVTGVHDGLPRPGAAVTLHDPKGRVRARGVSDREGLVRFDRLPPLAGEECNEWGCGDFDGYVVAERQGDRALVGINAYDPDLAPWRFNVNGAWGIEREPLAGTLFTERGIYRPGEPLYAKAIVRTGPLGALRAPAPGDSVRWSFNDREGRTMKDTTVALSAFGTSDQTLRLPAELPLGYYSIQLHARHAGQWRHVASTTYQVAEYRPPEFLVDVESDGRARFAGDSATFHVAGRYLFGAPMAGAPVRWVVRQRPLTPWEIRIPGADDYQIGRGYSYWDDDGYGFGARVSAEGAGSLDAAGKLDLPVQLPEPNDGRPARVDVLATVTDANRQTVSGGNGLTVHPAAFYIGAKVQGERYFWTAGEPVTVDVIALRPTGERVDGVRVEGTLVRREWHTVRRNRGGYVQEVGSWVQDTVASCTVRTGVTPAPCRITPPSGGSYTLTLTATDAAGRKAITSLSRWASGTGWVPWNDETKLKMDVIADRERYTVGDTATLLFASPFTDAEAWVTVERERVIESRRIRIASGATTLKFPITEEYAPNAFVSIVVVRGRISPPGPLDDPGRPAMRVGYAELRVTPEVKRLAVEVAPLRPEYRPGDTAAVSLQVKDANGRGQRAEVTLWAVDQGVLALTGYKTPDPIDLIYPARGVGMRLASNLAAVAAQIPEGQKGRRDAGGGGGADLATILRSRFQTTAFFLGSVVTDGEGRAVAKAKLPDNLTTFRVMAVAVTAGDRYGSGQSDLLVTRPLIARPALPRFVREGDRFEAGAVVNTRLPGSPRVKVEAKATGIKLEGKSKQTITLQGGRGEEVRFPFRAVPGDSARFQFHVSSGKEADAVRVAVPVRPFYYPLAQTVAGVAHDSASALFVLEPDVNLERSTIEISFGTSPLAFLRGAAETMRLYPYYCTEQIASVGLTLTALYRAGKELGDTTLANAHVKGEVETAVKTILRRQRPDGGIGYWSISDWTTPWLSAYAGRVLLEARAAGIAVPDTALEGLAGYLTRTLREPERPQAGIAQWLGRPGAEFSERLAAVDFLSRLGRPDIPAENSLLRQAARLSWEDRALLAEVLARRGQRAEARALLAPLTAGVRVEGRVAVLPDTATAGHYFASQTRPAARLLSALLAVEPNNPLVGPLVERITEQGRGRRLWNTQDFGYTALALLEYEQVRRGEGPSRVKITSGGRTVVETTVGTTPPPPITLPLRGLATTGAEGKPVVRLELRTSGGAPVYYYLTVREVPKGVQLNPVDRGIVVERWYEDVQTGKPIVAVRAGELVRVRLRLTVPTERNFVVLDDPLPAGLEAVDLSLRTVSPFGGREEDVVASDRSESWSFGAWDAGAWSPFDHKEMRDDRVVYFATVLWKGRHTATYLARATTAGTFLYPPAHAEEMYNPGVNGRTGGGEFRVVR
jgi:uncharacterized protein YfaS (alpha-2-macroglobulin family)